MSHRMRMPKEKTAFAKKLRKEATWAERRMWTFFCVRPWGLKWRRQAPILGWIADFYCPSMQFVLEIDGKGHDASRDAERDASLQRIGITVLRVSGEDVYARFNDVAEKIKTAVFRFAPDEQ